MAAGSSNSFATKSHECDEEFSEFCENFTFCDTVNFPIKFVFLKMPEKYSKINLVIQSVLSLIYTGYKLLYL